MRCPTDDIPLDAAQRCRRCGGQWHAGPDGLQSLFPQLREGLLTPEGRLKSPAFLKSRPCPSCQSRMLAPWRIGALEAWVYRCSECEGVWAGEPERRSIALANKQKALSDAVQSMPEPERRELVSDLARESLGDTAFEPSGGAAALMWLGIPIIRRAQHDRSPVGTLLLAALLAAIYAHAQWTGGTAAQIDALGLVANAYEPMRAFTANLAHFGLGHLIGNLVFLLPFGDGVEQRLGPVGVWALFFGIGTLSLSVEAAAWGTPIHIAGASGGVAALVGACVMLQPDARIFMRLGVRGTDVPIAVYGGIEFASQAFLALMGIPGVAYVAHASGLAMGALVGYGLRRILPAPGAA